jgi:hypothetical protein
MAVTKVKSLIDAASTILTDVTNVRWPVEELLGWLNEAYLAFVTVKPDCLPKIQEMNSTEGTLQKIPADGVRLLEVIKDNGKNIITVVERDVMDAAHRAWEQDVPSLAIDHYVFDEMSPKEFRLAPPAAVGVSVTIRYAYIPEVHLIAGYDDDSSVIRIGDEYRPALMDYILYRALSKDADFAGSAQRAMGHLQAASSYLGAELKMDIMTSPNK